MVPSHVQLLLQGCLQEFQSSQSFEIFCKDGKLTLNILVLNFICPTWLKSTLNEESALILPTVKMEDLDIFLTCLQSSALLKHLLPKLECSISNLSGIFNLDNLLVKEEIQGYIRVTLNKKMSLLT